MKFTISLSLLLLASIAVLRVLEPAAPSALIVEREPDVNHGVQDRPQRRTAFNPIQPVSAWQQRTGGNGEEERTRSESRSRHRAAESRSHAKTEPVETGEPVDRIALLAQTAASLLHADAREIVATVSAFPDAKEQRMLIQNLAVQQTGNGGIPDREWVGQLADRKLRAFAAETVAREWGRADLDAVWSWIEQTTDAELQAAAVSGAVWNLAQMDFAATTEWISGMEASELRDAAALKAAKIYALDRPREAVQWAAEFPAGELRESALSYGLHQWTATDVAAAADWAIGLEDENLQAKALPMIAAAWANRDPAAATDWVSGFPSDLRQPAMEETMRRWQKLDR